MSCLALVLVCGRVESVSRERAIGVVFCLVLSCLLVYLCVVELNRCLEGAIGIGSCSCLVLVCGRIESASREKKWVHVLYCLVLCLCVVESDRHLEAVCSCLSSPRVCFGV